MCLRSLQIKWRFNKPCATYLRHGLLLCHYIYHLHAMQSRHLEGNKTCNSYGKQCNWQSMQVIIKSVFIRKFHTQHNVLVHSTNYLCNENAQYLSLLKRIKIQRIQLIKNSFIMAYVQRRLDTLYALLKIVLFNLLFPGYYKFYYG